MRIIGILCAAIMALTAPAYAHRQPEMVSTVAYVTDGAGAAVTQVTHRIHAHDALKLVGVLDGVARADLDDPDVLARLGQYLAAQLQLDGEGVLIGQEIDRNSLFVYVEYAGHPALTGGTGLARLDPSWTHQVDLQRPGRPNESHTFSAMRGQRAGASTAATIP